MTFSLDKLHRVLGLHRYHPTNKYVCFLPFRGEFGWYIQTFVKRVQGYYHDNKIVCTKVGHECLFPSAQKFYYEWQDVSDGVKAGISTNEDEDVLKEKIRNSFGTDDIHFLSTSETSWEEKESLASYTFVPKSLHNFGLSVDVVIAPRNRTMDPFRNWTQANWQIVVDELVKNNITVGVCGARETCFSLENTSYKSFDHIDVDSDVELLTNAKLVVCQESGISYLSYLCKKPTFIIDHYLQAFGSDLHRDLTIPFKAIEYVWGNPMALVSEILSFFGKK